MAEFNIKGVNLYHEHRDGSAPSVVHCVNALVQGPLFGESDLAAIAVELDRKKHLSLLWQFGVATYATSHFRFGNFGVQIFQEALKKWDVQITQIHSPNTWKALIDFEQVIAFICHNDRKEDWTCVRKVAGEWYEFDCLYPTPEHVPEFYVLTYIDSLRCFGWTIYLVKGKLPGTCKAREMQACDDDGPRLPHEDDIEGTGMVDAHNGT